MVCLATAEKPWRASYKALGGRGAEAVIVTVGAIPAYEDAPKYLGRGGKGHHGWHAPFRCNG